MKDKKYKLKIQNIWAFFIFGLCFWFLMFSFSFALTEATKYNLIEPLPGIPSVLDFPDFISRFVPFLLAFAALAAFVQIVFGGILRATSGGNPTAISDANDRIQKAILGLILALAAFLILYTINPDLVSLRFFPERVEIAPTTTTTQNSGNEFASFDECTSQCSNKFGCVRHQTKQGVFVCLQVVQ